MESQNHSSNPPQNQAAMSPAPQAYAQPNQYPQPQPPQHVHTNIQVAQPINDNGQHQLRRGFTITRNQRNLDYNPAEAQNPRRMQCNNCNQECMTRVTKKTSSVQYMACYLLCYFCCWCCCCAPCYADELYVYNHFCSQCGSHIKKYDPASTA